MEENSSRHENGFSQFLEVLASVLRGILEMLPDDFTSFHLEQAGTRLEDSRDALCLSV